MLLMAAGNYAGSGRDGKKYTTVFERVSRLPLRRGGKALTKPKGEEIPFAFD